MKPGRNRPATAAAQHGAMRKRFSALMVALAFAGCASTTPTQTPQFTLPQLAPSSSAQLVELSIDRWWTLFGDAALERLMDEALSHNADLESALARVREAQAVLDGARGAQSPTLDAKAGAEKNRHSSAYRVSLEAAYDVDLWGKLSSATAAARHQLLATEWARASIEWGLTASVAQTYFELGAVDRQIVVSEAVRASRLNTVVLRNREYGAGAGSEFELRRAEAELAAAESTLVGLGRQRAALDSALQLLLGRNSPLDFARNPLDEAKPLTTVLPQGAAAELLVRRPDIRQSEAQLRAANASIDSARAATLPQLRLSGVLGSDAKSLSDLFTGPAALWSLGASLAQPIFDGGRLRARVAEEEARAAQSLASYRKTVAGAVVEVREAYANLDLTQSAFQAERERVASLTRAHELARRGYAAGALGSLDLLDAERNLYQAQLQQVSAYRDRLISQVAAFKALGGGYTNTGRSS
jgi:multidrug efflux system outer membrane protein